MPKLERFVVLLESEQRTQLEDMQERLVGRPALGALIREAVRRFVEAESADSDVA